MAHYTRIPLLILFGLTIWDPTVAHAETPAGYTTVWQVTNQTNEALCLTCHCTGPGLLPIRFHPDECILAGETYTHTWSTFHNDGLGLNACSWACTTTSAVEPGQVTASHFNSTWGEHVTLVMEPPNGALRKVTSDRASHLR